MERGGGGASGWFDCSSDGAGILELDKPGLGMQNMTGENIAIFPSFDTKLLFINYFRIRLQRLVFICLGRFQ